MSNKNAVSDGSHLLFKLVLGHPCNSVRLNVKCSIILDLCDCIQLLYIFLGEWVYAVAQCWGS